MKRAHRFPLWRDDYEEDRERPKFRGPFRPGIGRAERKLEEDQARMRVRQREDWERVRGEVTAARLSRKRLQELATDAPEPLASPLRQRRIPEYLQLSYEELRTLPGVGRAEVGGLMEFLCELLQAAERAEREAVAAAALRRLEAWAIPLDYPIELVGLTPRRPVLRARRGIDALGALVQAVPDGAVEGSALNAALAAGNADEVRQWLPLALGGRGLSFGVALQSMVRALPPLDRGLLECHLVHGQTHRAASAAQGCGAQRSQQLAQQFLARVQLFLDYFFPRGEQPRSPRRIAAADLAGATKAEVALIVAAAARAKQRDAEDWRIPLGPRATYRPPPEEP